MQKIQDYLQTFFNPKTSEINLQSNICQSPSNVVKSVLQNGGVGI